MLPEKALWGKGFFKTDTMVCAAPEKPSEDGAIQVICKGSEENKRFTCDAPERLQLCRTKIAYVSTSTNRTNGQTFTNSTLHKVDLTFFVDSSRTLRFIEDPAIGSYLKADSLSFSYYQRSLRDRKLYWASFGSQFLGAVGLMYFLVQDGIAVTPATATTATMFVGGYAGQFYFKFDGKKYFEKAIAAFQASK